MLLLQQFSLQIVQIGLGLLDLSAIFVIFQSRNHLALRDVVAFVDPNRGNEPDNLRGHFDSVGLSRKAGLVVAIRPRPKLDRLSALILPKVRRFESSRFHQLFREITALCGSANGIFGLEPDGIGVASLQSE